MRKIIVLVSIAFMLFIIMVNCTPKLSPAVSNVPSKNDIWLKYSSDQLAEGKQIFESHCNKCHALKDPASRTPEEWSKVLRKMIPRAKLGDSDADLARAYIIANSK